MPIKVIKSCFHNLFVETRPSHDINKTSYIYIIKIKNNDKN